MRRHPLPPALATAVAFAALFATASLVYPRFGSAPVVLNLLADNAVLGVLAAGMTLVILSGGIDLSVGSIVALSSITLALLIEHGGVPPPLAIAVVLAGGTVAGLAMGAVIQYLAVPAFIVTLAGMFLFRGAALALHRESIAIAHPFYRWISDAGVPLGGGLRLTVPALVFVAVTLAAAWLCRHTRSGRNVYALGGNEQAATLLGVPVARTRLLVYATSSLCAALGGVLLTIYLSSGNPTAGVALELEAIAAVVVGGTRLAGGLGGPLGTFFGVLIFGVIRTMLAFQGTLGPGWTSVAIGGLLLAFVALQRVLRRGAAP